MKLIYKGLVSYRTPCEFTPCDLTTYKADFESRFWKRWMILRTNWKIVFSHNSLLTSLNGTRIFREIDFFLGISRNLAKYCESWVLCEKHINYTLFFQILSAIFWCFWNKIVRKCAILEKILKILKIFEICPKNTAFFKKGAKIQLPTMKNSVSTSVRTRSGRYPLFPSGSERVKERSLLKI